MTDIDAYCQRRVAQSGRLAAEHDALRFDLEARVGAEAVEKLEAEDMRQGEKRGCRIVADRLAQRERAMCRELGQQLEQ
ncbi:MAG: hypothetical protein ACREEA_07945 [Stellaceae bacterium]